MDPLKLKLSDLHFERLRAFLFLDDFQERVAIGLCTRSGNSYFLHRLHFVPEDKVLSREEWNITWDMGEIHPFLSHIRRNPSKGLHLIKFHNHPSGYDRFSEADDESDLTLARTVSTWLERPSQVMSCVLLPGDKMFGRLIDEKGDVANLQIQVAGGRDLIRDLTLSGEISGPVDSNELNRRNRQVLGSATHEVLKRLKIGLVGYSGLGSPLFEQLLRLGCEHIVVVDPDTVEEKNLNRILNTTLTDAEAGLAKPEVAKRIALAVNPACLVETFCKDVADPEVVESLSSCDLLFGCMDSIDGRFILNLLSSAYIIPYIDLGVSLRAKRDGGVNSVEYRIDFLSPGRSSLLTREVYSHEEVEAAFERRNAPGSHERKVKEGYIMDIVDDGAPAVLPVNMEVAAIAVRAFLDRLHSFVDWGREFYDAYPARLSGNLACAHPRFAHQLWKEESFTDDSVLLDSLGKASSLAFDRFRRVE